MRTVNPRFISEPQPFWPYGPAGAGVEALSRVMAADLAGTSVTVNILLPGGTTATGLI
jgi:NAD(P)-dependent dehydrogenase (short-subunit alcohol dehydrogenase family)